MTYLEWLERFASLTPEMRANFHQRILALAHRPVISVILPVYNGDLSFLSIAIASVRRQIYENWELCLADDASTDSRIRPFLEGLAREDRRIKVLFREQNGHISACSNSALSLARGEWCALLDQDDKLAENALAEVACEIARHPDVAIIYSDEDFLDANGKRSNPFFKPDWNPELFLAQNYLNHLGVYRTSLLREIGGFREGFEGSQDYDLALRCVARSRPGQIRHIPRLLYHWRMVEGSLADEPNAKPYARHAARRALNSYLQERGIAAHAEACPQNAESHRVVYQPPDPLPRVTIVTTAQGHRLERTDYPAVEIIHGQTGAAGMNEGAKRAQGEVLLFAKREIEATEPGWLSEIVSHVVRPQVGGVGARLWSREGTLEDGGLILGLSGIAAPAFRGLPRKHPGYFNRAWLQQNYSALSATCLAVRREIFQELEGFDVENLPHHFYDVDFCLRLRERELQIVWTPYANLTLSDSGMKEQPASSQEASYMQARWGDLFDRDPFYNPNLSLDLPGFTLAIPPRTYR
ncbi:MAG: glycosyl transferase family 2 [Verrucomicrobia bacterium]|nr:MAG: glycosyl transferase family 2 [Verrucomicrobiota bacterium]